METANSVLLQDRTRPFLVFSSKDDRGGQVDANVDVSACRLLSLALYHRFEPPTGGGLNHLLSSSASSFSSSSSPLADQMSNDRL